MIIDKITMIQIKYFLAVAKFLNFTQAAKSLYVSQPSLSKQVALLESALGIQLFSRTKRNVALTPAGKVLCSEICDIKERLEVAFEKAKMAGPGGMDTIRIGCLDAMDTDLFLPKMIELLKEDYPDTVIVLERHCIKILKEKLLNGTLDVIFTLSFDMDDSLKISSDIVYNSPGNIYMASSHSLAKRESVTVEDLKSENFIVISPEVSLNGFNRTIDICIRNGFSPKIVKQAPNIESLLLCIKSGLGVAILDSYLRLYNKDRYKLFKIEDDFVGIVIAWKNGNLHKTIQFFTGPLLKKFKKNLAPSIG